MHCDRLDGSARSLTRLVCLCVCMPFFLSSSYFICHILIARSSALLPFRLLPEPTSICGKVRRTYPHLIIRGLWIPRLALCIIRKAILPASSLSSCCRFICLVLMQTQIKTARKDSAGSAAPGYSDQCIAA